MEIPSGLRLITIDADYVESLGPDYITVVKYRDNDDDGVSITVHNGDGDGLLWGVLNLNHDGLVDFLLTDNVRISFIAWFNKVDPYQNFSAVEFIAPGDIQILVSTDRTDVKEFDILSITDEE